MKPVARVEQGHTLMFRTKTEKKRAGKTMRFDERVYALVVQIPAGRVCAYGDVAAALGSPRAARQVGFALARLPHDRAEAVPWHRVINARGMISGQDDLMRPELQRELLRSEGVVFNSAHRCALDRLRFLDFEPLDTAGD